MEILGKLLSLVLVTFLGVAVTYVYVLEYDNKPQTDNVLPDNDYSDSDQSAEISKYRQELRDFKPIEVPERHINVDKSPLWGEQTVNTFSTQNINLQASELANKYKLDDINKELVYWHTQYKNLIKDESNKKPAKDAYLKYKIFKEAARLKSSQ